MWWVLLRDDTRARRRGDDDRWRSSRRSHGGFEKSHALGDRVAAWIDRWRTAGRPRADASWREGEAVLMALTGEELDGGGAPTRRPARRRAGCGSTGPTPEPHRTPSRNWSVTRRRVCRVRFRGGVRL